MSLTRPLSRTARHLCCFGLLSLTSHASAMPIQWKIADGGNGHYYEFFRPEGGITWTDARNAAAAQTYLGGTGHLITFNSQQEWDFILLKMPEHNTWIGLSDAVSENVFEWVTGEPFVFEAWGLNEPNNAGNEDYAYMGSSSNGWGWNDYKDVLNPSGSAVKFGYIVEYSNVLPEPSTYAMAALGLVGLGFFAWRRRRSLRS